MSLPDPEPGDLPGVYPRDSRRSRLARRPIMERPRRVVPVGFLETVARAKNFLSEHGRVSLRGLKREFELDDDALDELVDELVDVQQVAAREGKVLVWIGAAGPEQSFVQRNPPPTHESSSEPGTRRTPEAERRQLTVLLAGVTEEALAAVDHALLLMERSGEALWKANAMALRGDLLLARGLVSDAEVWYRAGVELARSQSARMWELRAATRLARLWQGQHRTDEARDLLAPIYGWFTEGFDTPDLEDARALLEELE